MVAWTSKKKKKNYNERKEGWVKLKLKKSINFNKLKKLNFVQYFYS